jgi:DNA-binding transcriptional LysR family regulator
MGGPRGAPHLLATPLVHALAVADHRSIGKAASALHLTQPALSKSLRRLERSLGVRLFERSAHGVTPTRPGAALLEHARRMQASARAALRELDDLRGVSRSGVNVAIGPGAPLHLLRVATEHFADTLRSHEVTLVEIGTAVLVERLARGEFDLAVVAGAPRELPAGLEREVLLEDPGVAVVAAPGLERATPEAVLARAERWVLPPGRRLRAIVDRLHESRGLRLPRVARTTSLALATTMLQGAGTASVLPYSWALGVHATGGARLLALPEIDWELPVLVLRRADAAALPVRRFAEALRAAAGRFRPPDGER